MTSAVNSDIIESMIDEFEWFGINPILWAEHAAMVHVALAPTQEELAMVKNIVRINLAILSMFSSFVAFSEEAPLVCTERNLYGVSFAKCTITAQEIHIRGVAETGATCTSYWHPLNRDFKFGDKFEILSACEGIKALEFEGNGESWRVSF